MNLTWLKNKFKSVTYTGPNQRATASQLSRVIARMDGILEERAKELKQAKG